MKSTPARSARSFGANNMAINGSDPVVNKARAEGAGADTGELAVACVIAGVLMVAWLPFARIGVDMHHDGIMLKPALDVLDGQVLFRDTFSQYGPLTTLIQSAGLWVSPSLHTLKVMSVAANVMSLFFLYAAWREVISRWLAAAGVLLAVAFVPFFHQDWPVMPWSSDYAMLFQSITLYALLRALGEGGWRHGVLTGVGAAATFWCRQPVGLTLAVAVVVSLGAAVASGWRAPVHRKTAEAWLGLAAGGIVTSAVMLGGMALNGALPYWWEQNIVWPSRWADPSLRGLNIFTGQFARQTLRIEGLPVLLAGLFLVSAPWLAARVCGRSMAPRFFAAYWMVLLVAGWLAWDYWAGWFVIPGAGWTILLPVSVASMCVYSIVRAAGARMSGRPAELNFYRTAALAGLSLASLAQYYPVPCPRHVFWSLAAGCGVLVLGIHRCSGAPPRAVAAGVAVLLAPALWAKGGWALGTLGQPGVVLERPSVLAGMKVGAVEAEFYAWLDDVHGAVAKGGGDRRIVLFGIDAMILVMARDRENPGPYYVTWWPAIPAEEQRLRWRWLTDRRPAIITHNYAVEKLGRFFSNEGYYHAGSCPEAGVDLFAPEEWRDTFVPPPAPRWVPKR